jgi:hypothetical protein
MLSIDHVHVVRAYGCTLEQQSAAIFWRAKPSASLRDERPDPLGRRSGT